ncbi:MAG: ATP-grasp domain-containing protein [Leptospiraceae bacterium]|nr:ATP-grasp domain-containing protein [Leptospiraceae bacterium]MCP5501291.1 ATP-grasp domain-containing protein [Leptospiraceae bacterium]
MKIEKLLIANRGEIALRVIRTCKKLGITSVAVYSDADKNACFVKMADEAYHIGESEASASYLQIDRILEVCKRAEVDAVHPGYGFLSENPVFAEKLKQNHIIFIGPEPESIRQMGSKSLAKALMSQHKVPVVPGYNGESQDEKLLLEKAKEIGFPLLIKASAGGGGKGMKLLEREEDFSNALSSAKREAMNFFKDDHVLLEKYIQKPRHIEFQIFGDKHGNVKHLFERDCSVQRRHQKIVEESPAGLPTELRKKMAEAAVNAARAISYVGAGTIEFILSEDLSFYFLEMNTRLQVEHPVTEMVTGLDLVELQIRLALGESLENMKWPEQTRGHSIEVRVYAEDPENKFLPSIGVIRDLHFPSGQDIRIDNGVEKGSVVSIYYDPMIAKLIVKAQDRANCIDLLLNTLKSSYVFGLTTNINYLTHIISHPEFIKGNVDTGFIQKYISSTEQEDIHDDLNILLAYSYIVSFVRIHVENLNNYVVPLGMHNHDILPGSGQDSFSISDDIFSEKMEFRYKSQYYSLSLIGKGGDRDHSYFVVAIQSDDKLQEIQVPALKTYGRRRIITNKNEEIDYLRYGTRFFWHFSGKTYSFDLIKKAETARNRGDDSYFSPMPGKVLKMFMQEGEEVKEGALLLIIEAMKMENEIKANRDGVIKEVHVKEGELVPQDAPLLTMEAV